MFTFNPDRIYFFDGAMGTMLQSHGLKLRELPESLNFTNPDLIRTIHSEYSDAGANFISANTFGANRFKLAKSNLNPKDVIIQALTLANEITQSHSDSYSVLDIGPTGRVMSPVGDASFDEVYDAFAEMVIAGRDLCDAILLETFTDLYELKAAVLAARENSDLPVFATMSFDESGHTFFGTTIEAMTYTLEGLGIDALGVNCSLGPAQLVPVVKRICEISHIPVMVQPNAGLPVMRNGESHYDVTPDEFAEIACEFASMGVNILGGCCGTSPAHISKMKHAVLNVHTHSVKRNVPDETVVCSASKTVTFGKKFVVIGERLNPTGKKMLQKALREGNTDYLLKEALKQQDQDADILDLNTGLPDINEAEVLTHSLKEIQGITNLPIQIDSSDHKTLEAGARIYNGKPLLNSVNGKPSSLENGLRIAKKYGACILGLTLDENGIPETAEERFRIAERIINEASRIGIPRRNILIDCLTLTASAQQKLVPETLKAIRMVKDELGVCTVLGLSNVSFGLPRRPLVNRTMLIAAIMNGLDSAIINPGDSDLKESLYAWNLLSGDESDMQNYIAYCEAHPANTNSVSVSVPQSKTESTTNDLNSSIVKGLNEDAAKFTREMLSTKKPLEIIEQNIVPAEAAKSAFEVLSEAMSREGSSGKSKGPVLLATVYGDVHDIGKNIVRTIFENYNFDVIDLGKDVPPDKVVEAVKRDDVHVVGLSALMTTTVASMKETIEKIKASCPDVKVIAGGAVLTPELAKYAGADYYARDAMEGVRIVSGLLS